MDIVSESYMSQIHILKNELLKFLIQDGFENPNLELRIIMEQLEPYIEGEYINKEGKCLLESIMKTLYKGKPIQYQVGYTYIKNNKILINTDVLLPGPEMEVMLDICKNYIRDGMNVLDLGTGCGVLSAILAKIYAGSRFYSIDISERALNIAKKNIIGIYNIDLIRGDIMNPIFNDKSNIFDVIISNPPYCKTKDIESLPIQIKMYAPRIAIDGGSDGLKFHKKIIQFYKKYLKDNGILILQNENLQSIYLQKLLKYNGFNLIEIIRNQKEQERFIVARIVHE